MVTVYDKDGNAIQLDGCDARERIGAGLAFKERPMVTEESAKEGDGSNKEPPPDPKSVASMERKEMMAELDAAKVAYAQNISKYDLQAMITALRAK